MTYQGSMQRWTKLFFLSAARRSYRAELIPGESVVA